MSACHRARTAKKACTRCRHQKRRCDRAVPQCGLCRRLHQSCKYDVQEDPPSDVAPLANSRIDLLALEETLTPNHVKNAIIERLGSITPNEVLTEYHVSIDPWFPILSHISQRDLPAFWAEMSIGFAILCLCIIMLRTKPPSSPEDNRFRSLYLCTKSWIGLLEGFGIHSLELVQARTLVTLFEVVHGLYPAAYISIGTTVRAADALDVHPTVHPSPLDTSGDEAHRQEAIFLWCGIYILDRYIAVESGSRLSVTSSLTPNIHDLLKATFYPTVLEQNRTSPICRLSRFFEASTLLDKMHTTLHSSTAERAFNLEELLLLIDTSTNLQTILMRELGSDGEVYSGELSLCNTGLFLAYENGSKLAVVDDVTTTCNSIGTMSLNSLLATVASTVEPFVDGTTTADFGRLSPFIAFLVYRAAALVTERLLIENTSKEGLKTLRILRAFLRTVGTRWLCCERYLDLLNENTTPRILKLTDQEYSASPRTVV